MALTNLTPQCKQRNLTLETILKAYVCVQDEERRREALQWFEEGEVNGCVFSAFELWKSSNQPLVKRESVCVCDGVNGCCFFAFSFVCVMVRP